MSTLKQKSYVFAASAIAALTLLTTSTVTHAGVDFSNKNIDWIIPFKEGGGSDKWARFYAPLLSEALPGQPSVTVKNIPGAGSTKGSNWFAKSAPADGSVIMGTSGSTQFPYLLGDSRVEFDYADWTPVLASATGGVAYLPKDLGDKWNKDKKSIFDVNFNFASQGATRLDLIPLLAFEMLGLKVTPIFGIKGRGDGRLMFERGEVNIDYQTSSSFLSKVTPLVESGEAVPMMTWGALDSEGNIVRDPTFPNMPTFKEVYTEVHGEAPSGESWDAWKAFFVAGFSAQKMVFLKNETDQEVIDAFSDAFKDVTERDDFAEISKARLGIYEQVTGDAANLKKEMGTNVDGSSLKFVKSWLNDRYGVEL